jgi:hypothetical protein
LWVRIVAALDFIDEQASKMRNNDVKDNRE